MFYAHAQKQTNKHNFLSLALSLSLCCLATFGPPPFLFGQSYSPSEWSSIPKEQLLLLLFLIFHLSLAIVYLRQHNSFNTVGFFLFFFCSTLWHFLRRARVCLETHKLFGHLVVGPLREYPHDGDARFVHGDALHQRVAGGAAALVCQLFERDDGHADDAVLTGKAVVLHWDMELIDLWTVFVTQNTEKNDKDEVGVWLRLKLDMNRIKK